MVHKIDKLDLLEQHIISLLLKREPEYQRWSEIVNSLWQEPFKSKYKDKKGFGVAVTNKLHLLEAAGKIECQGHSYRTIQSSKKEQDKIKTAIEELRNELKYLREPKIKEVAEKTSKTPEKIEPALYALAQETGWSEPDENAPTEAKDAINLAGWLNAEKNNQIPPQLKEDCENAKAKASKRTLQRAQMIQNKYPSIVPKIIDARLIWPNETKTTWYQIFKTEPPAPKYPSQGKSIYFSKTPNNPKNYNNTF